MYLRKLERIQKQTEARGELTPEKTATGSDKNCEFAAFKNFCLKAFANPHSRGKWQWKTSVLFPYGGKEQISR